MSIKTLHPGSLYISIFFCICCEVLTYGSTTLKSAFAKGTLLIFSRWMASAQTVTGDVVDVPSSSLTSGRGSEENYCSSWMSLWAHGYTVWETQSSKDKNKYRKVLLLHPVINRLSWEMLDFGLFVLDLQNNNKAVPPLNSLCLLLKCFNLGSFFCFFSFTQWHLRGTVFDDSSYDK